MSSFHAATAAFECAFAALEDAVRSGRIPGGVLGCITRSGVAQVRAVGDAQREPTRHAMQENTLFDLASLTKVLFTTPHILALVEAGRIDLDAPLARLLPDLCQYDTQAWERKVSVRQCLGHQTPFPAVVPLYTYQSDPQRLRAFVLQHRWPSGPPVYSDINFILLGIVLERLQRMPLRKIAPAEGLTFTPDPAQCAATEYCHWRERVMLGEVHDENCHALHGAGHAGLFGHARAVLAQAQRWLCTENSATVRTMRAPLSSTRTHGWERPYPGWSGGDRCSAETIGHTGFTGTGLWIDFQCGLAWTLLTNRVHPSRHVESGILPLRRVVGDALVTGACGA